MTIIDKVKEVAGEAQTMVSIKTHEASILMKKHAIGVLQGEMGVALYPVLSKVRMRAREARARGARARHDRASV